MTSKVSGDSARDAVAAVAARLSAGGCVFAQEEARLFIGEARSDADLDAMVQRRLAGWPVEQLVGWAEFCGLRIAVEPGVFVPRRRTEFLAAEAVRLARRAASRPSRHRPPDADPSGPPPPVVVDLCCGSGAIAAVLLAQLDALDLYAADIDPVAVRCARRNLEAGGGRVYEGDLFSALPPDLRGRIDVLVANVPYVPSADLPTLPAEARLHEPPVALDGGPDGLDIARRVAGLAPLWLAPGGSLLIETSRAQAPVARDWFARQGLASGLSVSPELGATVVIGTLPLSGM